VCSILSCSIAPTSYGDCTDEEQENRGYAAGERGVAALATRSAAGKPGVCLPTAIDPHDLEQWAENQVCDVVFELRFFFLVLH
jgi:hypothetical protein